MDETYSTEIVRVVANSPGRYPILVVELSDGQLKTVYHETCYDLEHSKTVEENWLRENAIGRHSFVEVNPPREMEVSDLVDYARRELSQAP